MGDDSPSPLAGTMQLNRRKRREQRCVVSAESSFVWSNFSSPYGEDPGPVAIRPTFKPFSVSSVSSCAHLNRSGAGRGRTIGSLARSPRHRNSPRRFQPGGLLTALSTRAYSALESPWRKAHGGTVSWMMCMVAEIQVRR
jgi:hypothetical protein